MLRITLSFRDSFETNITAFTDLACLLAALRPETGSYSTVLIMATRRLFDGSRLLRRGSQLLPGDGSRWLLRGLLSGYSWATTRGTRRPVLLRVRQHVAPRSPRSAFGELASRARLWGLWGRLTLLGSRGWAVRCETRGRPGSHPPRGSERVSPPAGWGRRPEPE